MRSSTTVLRWSMPTRVAGPWPSCWRSTSRPAPGDPLPLTPPFSAGRARRPRPGRSRADHRDPPCRAPVANPTHRRLLRLSRPNLRQGVEDRPAELPRPGRCCRRRQRVAVRLFSHDFDILLRLRCRPAERSRRRKRNSSRNDDHMTGATPSPLVSRPARAARGRRGRPRRPLAAPRRHRPRKTAPAARPTAIAAWPRRDRRSSTGCRPSFPAQVSNCSTRKEWAPTWPAPARTTTPPQPGRRP